jgi:gamma-glutamyltranspeptidase/glutathione hydrolase
MTPILRLLALILLVVAPPASAQQTGAAERYMVVAADARAAEAGRAVLAAGGTAADAAVAIQAMLTLVEPQSSGIGGGAFALYWDAATGSLTTWDGRETAPAAATPDYWMGPGNQPVQFRDAVRGGRSVGVPGTVALLAKLHAAKGRQAWAPLFDAAIRTADEGFAITPRLARMIANSHQFHLNRDPATRAYFLNPDDTPKAIGDVLVNPALADTLRDIALNGPAAFYTGPRAERIAAATQTETNTGMMTVNDLAGYKVVERPSVCFPYRSFDICSMGPPSSGALTIGQILTMLSAFDLTAAGPSRETLHLYIEASKLAFADRFLYMADGDFVTLPEGLLDPAYLRRRAFAINPNEAMGRAEAGNPPWKQGRLYAPDLKPEIPGTSHFSIVDSYGNVLSMTTTIEGPFGSGLMVNGFMLNNELTDFSFLPEWKGRTIANRVEGGKRPRSSMSPTIVFKDGTPVWVLGSPGGSAIIAYVTQTLIALIDWNMPPVEAVALGRVINRNGKTTIEEKTPLVRHGVELTSLGQEVQFEPVESGLNMIEIGPSGLIGVADPRREGVVLGE